MKTKKYYKIIFQLQEPLSLGSGENRYSDKDLLRDGQGNPFIPGSSLCGVYRSCLGEKESDQYFGSMTDQGDTKESAVIVYDAVLQDQKCTTSIRDSVGLDEYRTAKQGAKFDFELIEPGAVFITYLEQEFSGDDQCDVGKKIAEAFERGAISLGHKSMRGCGRVKACKDGIFCRKFDLEKPEELEKWLDFDYQGENAFGTENLCHPQTEGSSAGQIEIELKLALRGGISIRRYTTDQKEDHNNQPDYVQMYYAELEEGGHGKETAFIPGTSWAGAFHHHMERLLPKSERAEVLHDYFGIGTQEKPMRKSRIRFSESRMEGGHWKITTRTAIDRFTGGAVDSALYTERFYSGGTTTLCISFPEKVGAHDRLWRQAAAAAVADLDNGFLAVGGLTSVGRGLFEVQELILNGKGIYRAEGSKKMSGCPELYQVLISELEETKGEA